VWDGDSAVDGAAAHADGDYVAVSGIAGRHTFAWQW
jgi:hypothetical protein